MCCLFTALVLLGPRIGGALWWLFYPARWALAFNNFPLGYAIWPILGLIFLPWTTIMFVAVFPGGLSFIDWVFIVLAVVIDVGSYGGGAFGNRDRFSTT